MAAVITRYGWIVFPVLHQAYTQIIVSNGSCQGYEKMWGSRGGLSSVDQPPGLGGWQNGRCVWHRGSSPATRLSSISSPSSFCALSVTAPRDGEDLSGLLHYHRCSPVTAHLRDIIAPHQHLAQAPNAGLRQAGWFSPNTEEWPTALADPLRLLSCKRDWIHGKLRIAHSSFPFPKASLNTQRKFSPMIYFYGKLPSEQSDSLGIFEIMFGEKI